MKEIGYVMSGCSQRLIPFVVKEGERVAVNNYYFIIHPARSSSSDLTPVLIRVFRVTPYNPEMSCGRVGPMAGKKGERTKYGKKLEYEIAWAESLGYFNGGKWRGLECSPGTWDPVFAFGKEELKEFFAQTFKSGGATPHLLQIGYHKGSSIPAFIDLNAVARGHMFVAGMTRSGKSTFILNVVLKSTKLDPQPTFIIFDKRGEFFPLTEHGAIVMPYHRFSSKHSFKGEFVANKLGFDIKTSTGRLIVDAVEALKAEGKELSKKSLWEKCQELAPLSISRDRDRSLKKLRWAVDSRGAFLDKGGGLDIISTALQNPVIIVDFSVDADVDLQLMTARSILSDLMRYSTARRDHGDFAAIVVMEEVQYYAPERGLNLEVGDLGKTGVSKQLIEAISQAGGYNLGFIILTQRPAYVAKSVISQCNTIVCFRLMSGNDQDAVLKYTEYGDEHLREYLPCLADHEAIAWGAASPAPFPTIITVDVQRFPGKSGATAREAWERMRRWGRPDLNRGLMGPSHVA